MSRFVKKNDQLHNFCEKLNLTICPFVPTMECPLSSTIAVVWITNTKNNSYEKVSYNFDDGARIGVRHIL